MHTPSLLCFVFFFNDTATTEIYTLSLHDALPICGVSPWRAFHRIPGLGRVGRGGDRKSTRLNSSHPSISYAVFCLKKKQKRIGHRPSALHTPRATAARTTGLTV